MARAKNMKGVRVGRLEVVERHGYIGKDAAWLCACVCGGITILPAAKIGRIQSCGCLLKETKAAFAAMMQARRLPPEELARRDKALRSVMKGVKECRDYYIASLLKMPRLDIPKALIEAKREAILLQRLARELKRESTKGAK